MKKIVLTIFTMVMAVSFIIPVIYAEEPPTVTDAVVESITLEATTINEVSVDASHFVYTFKLNKVNTWADKCYFKVWVDAVLVAEWAVGFSANTPPGLQGIYPEYDAGLVRIITVMAEFPFASEDINGEIYYSYRMHFYFDTEVFKGGEVRVAGDYMHEPTYEGSELTVLKILNSRIIDGVEVVKYKQFDKLPGWARK